MSVLTHSTGAYSGTLYTASSKFKTSRTIDNTMKPFQNPFYAHSFNVDLCDICKHVEAEMEVERFDTEYRVIERKTCASCSLCACDTCTSNLETWVLNEGAKDECSKSANNTISQSNNRSVFHKHSGSSQKDWMKKLMDCDSFVSDVSLFHHGDPKCPFSRYASGHAPKSCETDIEEEKSCRCNFTHCNACKQDFDRNLSFTIDRRCEDCKVLLCPNMGCRGVKSCAVCFRDYCTSCARTLLDEYDACC